LFRELSDIPSAAQHLSRIAINLLTPRRAVRLPVMGDLPKLVDFLQSEWVE
jgi:hypothetical protein